MKITAVNVSHGEAPQRQVAAHRQLRTDFASVESALGAAGAADMPDVKAVRRLFRRNAWALLTGLVGAAVAFAVLKLTPLGANEQTALMVLLVGAACTGLALVALVALVGAWLENFSVARLVLLQSKLDAAEANDVVVATVDGLSALREVRAWPAPVAKAELTDEVVAFAYDRGEGVPFDDLRAHYVKIAVLAKDAAPNKAAAENLLRRLRPQGVNWPTDVASAAQMAEALARG
jgi:hypothetical protein